MTTLWSEVAGQPGALRDLATYYLNGLGQELLESVPLIRGAVFTGMGASYHAAWIGVLGLNRLGIPAAHLEATDLLHYAQTSLNKDVPVFYFSQSGASAEVGPLLEILQDRPVIAITNDPESPLACGASLTLPLLAGKEQWIASKTYLNSLELAWLLGQRHAASPAFRASEQLERVAGRCQSILERSSEVTAAWLELFESAQPLIFVGHGPHAATARQAAMIVSEWAKRQALYASAGGFRHGFIEMAGQGAGAVVFAPPGRTQESALALARELAGYGMPVLAVANGDTSAPGAVELTHREIDEFLSPALDILPVQVFVDRLAVNAGIEPGFRRIEKVVKRL